MEKLSIVAARGKVIDEHFISPPPLLRDLFLCGKIKKLLDWVPMLQNLERLCLEFCNLTDDPFKSLQNMPNLLYLRLTGDFNEGEMVQFQEGGFQKLKELNLAVLHKCSSIVIHRGALRSLKILGLSSIPNLRVVPSGIQNLENLEVLEISYMSKKFNKSIVPDEGEPEHPAINHVPLVRIVATHTLTQGKKTHVIHHSRS